MEGKKYKRITRQILGFLILFYASHSSYAQTTQTLTTASSSPWTVPAGVTTVTIECWGAGGGGGFARSVNGAAGGGGGGGGYTKNTSVNVTAGSTISFTVGIGGNGGTAGGTAAISGGATTFSTVAIANADGGSAGTNVTSGNGAGGAGGAGVTFSGGAGATGQGNSGGGGGGGSAGISSNGNTATTQTGATAVTGGGNGGNGANNSTGGGGGSPGGGGAGGNRNNNNRGGGAGSDGQIIITYCQSVTIGTQPVNAAVTCSGGNASFNVSASGSIASYQWQRDPNTGTFADITSSAMDVGVSYGNYNTSTLNLTGVTTSVNNYKYRCVITASAACSQTVTSSSATLSAAASGPLNGSYTIGGGGSPNYASLTDAFAAMSCSGISGNVNLILQSGYVSTVETFPLVAYPNATSYSITIYPAVSGLSITSSNATGTFDFDAADNYILDGRVNKAGSMDLIVENTNTGGYAIQFINDASYNTIKYCNVKGVNNSGSEGVVFFNTAASVGNDYNTIDHCDIHDGASTPNYCIYSSGTSGEENDFNTVSNCNIYNFYQNNSLTAGIALVTYNSDWTISGNSFYQTSSRVPTSATDLLCIYIDNTGNNYVVSGNYIGGSAANCGGSALSFDAGATQNNVLYPIYVSSGTSGACTVQSNTVTNITFGVKAGTLNNYNFIGIAISAGYVNVSNNVIGGATGTGAITVAISTSSSRNSAIAGIYSTVSSGSVSRNTIGSITVSGGASIAGGGNAYPNSLNGIDCHGALTADFTISNNTIGSTTTANSMQTGSTSAYMDVTGIWLGTTNTQNVTVSDNVIQNLTSNSTDNSGISDIYGIYNYLFGSSPTTITRNTISNLSTTIQTTGGIAGIYGANTTSGQTISNNSIHDLFNTYNGATATDIYGIYYAGPTSGTNAISANTIYNLSIASTSTVSAIYGNYIKSGLATTSNNMITLGNGITKGYAITGIYQSSATSANNHYFNSVYIGGTASAAGSNTNAFYSVSATHTIQDNIFYNARTQSAGAGNHYAINVAAKTNITSDYNDLYSSVAANLGLINATAETFANWKSAAPAGDANSVNGNPGFLAPTSATTPDLHLTSSTTSSVVVTKGTSVAGITSDIDNDVRSSTPDMGADEYHTNYYSKSSGNLELTSSWGLNTDGSGANPPNFTTRDCSFNIRNNPSPTIGAAWSVTGAGNLIILGDGTSACNFTIPGAYACTGTVNISNNGTLTNQNAANPTFNVLNSNSTVNYNAASGTNQTVSSAATYGNIIISNSTGSGSSIKSLAASVSIVGDLTVNGYATFDIATYNANRTGGGGTLTLASNGILRLSGTANGASTNNNFPNNFSTMTLASGSTTEYYGATQTTYNQPTYGNLTISTSGTKTAGGAHTVAGVFTINSPATFAASTYTHNFKGNFVNNGTFTANTSTANFNGTFAQTISGSSTTTFYKFTLNNSTGVTLSAPANISNALGLTSGLLNTDATNVLTMQNGSTAPSITATSATYVNGPMKYQKSTSGSSTLNFPIGTSPDCRPFILTVNHASASQYNYTAQTFNANPWTAFGSTSTDMPSTVDTISGVHYWTISRTDASNASQPSLELSGNQQIQLFFGTNDGVYQGSGLTIVKNTAATPATWIDIGGTSALGNFSSAQVGSVTSSSSPTAFNSFSSFSLGSKSTGWDPLPIELLTFSASPIGEAVNVKWQTSTETNNKFFTIERSADGVNFIEMATVNSKAPNGNSQVTLSYQTTDASPLSGTSYYRLKQTDYNGKFKYFNMVSVNLEASKNVTFSIYPNPNLGEFTIDFSGIENNHEVQIVLVDELGKEVYANSIYSNSINSNQVQIMPTSKIAKGKYFCSLIFEGIKKTVVVIVN